MNRLRENLVAISCIVFCAYFAPTAIAQTQQQGEQVSAQEKQTKSETEKKPEAKKKSESPRLQQTIVVSATRSERSTSDLPVSATVIDSSEIETTPARTLDDILREVPGVDLPNASSRNQFPGLNRLSMRGLAGNRALALVDGIPLNDAYTGAVNWKRIPSFEIQRIEVVRGANASLFGNYAMGGTIDIVTKDALQDSFNIDTSWGTFNSLDTNLGISHRISDSLGLALYASHSSSGGYIRAAPDFRGPVDIAAASHTNVFNLRADWQKESGLGGFARAGWYEDYINLGTASSRADTSIGDGSAGLHFGIGSNSVITSNVFFQHEREHTTNARANSDRTSAYISNINLTSFDNLGGSVQWSWGGHGPISSASVGVDLHEIDVTDPRATYSSSGAYTSETLTLGKQQFLGVFGILSWLPTERSEVLVSGRVDQYSNRGGIQTDQRTGEITTYPDASKTAISPRISYRFDLSRVWSARAAVYRAFRAPTTSNLYLRSEVGRYSLIGNPELGPEILNGGEVGLSATTSRLHGEMNLFDEDIRDLITRVVVSTTPRPTQQSQNIGSARSRGVELIGSWTISPRWSVLANYSFTDSVVTSNPTDPALVGNRVPDVPRHSGSASIRWMSQNGATATLRARSETARFYDAENLQTMGGALIVDIFASWRVRGGMELFVRGENLTDRTYIVDRIAMPRIGDPRGFYGGIRFQMSPSR